MKQLKPVAERADNQYGVLGHCANHDRFPLGTQIGPRHLSRWGWASSFRPSAHFGDDRGRRGRRASGPGRDGGRHFDRVDCAARYVSRSQTTGSTSTAGCRGELASPLITAARAGASTSYHRQEAPVSAGVLLTLTRPPVKETWRGPLRRAPSRAVLGGTRTGLNRRAGQQARTPCSTSGALPSCAARHFVGRLRDRRGTGPPVAARALRAPRTWVAGVTACAR